MQIRELDPLGAEVRGVDLRDPLPDADVDRLVRLLADRGVVVVPDQHDLDDDAFAAFLQRFGAPVFTPGETPVPDHPDLNLISNMGRTEPPRSTFHVDTSYVDRPPAYTALRAVEVPAQGGQTLFADSYAAHDTLPADLLAEVADARIRHVVTGVEPPAGSQTEAWHPVLRPHPVSGRTALFLTTPARCAEVSGRSPEDSEALVARLFAHATDDARVLRHAWQPGDVVIWDNGCVLHRADHSGVVGDRVMHRGMALGYAAAG